MVKNKLLEKVLTKKDKKYKIYKTINFIHIIKVVALWLMFIFRVFNFIWTVLIKKIIIANISIMKLC
jgi:hypothetical protein